MSQKVKEIVANRLIDMIESSDTLPWRQPWRGTGPRNLVSGKEYRGVNALLLGMASVGRSCPFWLTARQAKDYGSSILPSELKQYMPVVYFRSIEDKRRRNDDGKKKTFPLLVFSQGFSVDQCVPSDALLARVEKMKEKFLTAQIVTDADVEAAGQGVWDGWTDRPALVEGAAAAYQRNTDTIIMPPKVSFNTSLNYWLTLFHESAHATGSPDRLNRTKGRAFGDNAYSFEELVAEIAAAMIAGSAGIDVSADVLRQSADYITGWKKKLKENPMALYDAASLAQKAADWVVGKRQEETADEPAEAVAV